MPTAVGRSRHAGARQGPHPEANQGAMTSVHVAVSVSSTCQVIETQQSLLDEQRAISSEIARQFTSAPQAHVVSTLLRAPHPDCLSQTTLASNAFDRAFDASLPASLVPLVVLHHHSYALLTRHAVALALCGAPRRPGCDRPACISTLPVECTPTAVGLAVGDAEPGAARRAQCLGVFILYDMRIRMYLSPRHRAQHPSSAAARDSVRWHCVSSCVGV